MRKIILFLFSTIIFGRAFAQNITTNLDPVTISGTFYETKASKTGRNITVITAKDIAQLPVRTPDELLRFLPGVDVQSRGAFGAQSDISIRGGTFQQVLVILDGLRLNDPNTGHFSGYIPVILDEIEKIEILKGASSGVFGSDAVGGVIFITTKTFSQKKQDGKNANMQLSAGQLGLLSTSGYFSSSKNNQQFQVSALRNSADGPQQRGITGFMREHAYAVAFSKKTKYWATSFRTAYNDREFAAQNFYTSFSSDTAVERVKIFWNQFNAQYQKNKNQVMIYAGFKNTEDNYRFSSVSSANSSFSNLFQLNTLFLRNHNEQTKYTIGAQYVGRNIRSNDRGNHTVHQVALYGIWQQFFSNHFSANTSLRAEYLSTASWVLVPQVNLSYQVAQIQLRASAGYAYRNADFTELYNNYNRSGLRSGSIGNPNLGAEKSFNYEVGLDWITASTSKISFSAFSRNSRDLIDWTLTTYADMPRRENLTVGGNYLLAKNQRSVQVSGLELDYILEKKISENQTLKLKAGLIWLDTKNDIGPLSFYLSSAPKLLTNFSSAYSTKWVDINFTGLYKSRTPQSANPILVPISNNYFVMNTKISFRFKYIKHIVFIQADNLLNSSINDFIGAPLPGRWLQIGGRLIFN